MQQASAVGYVVYVDSGAGGLMVQRTHESLDPTRDGRRKGQRNRETIPPDDPSVQPRHAFENGLRYPNSDEDAERHLARHLTG